MGGLARITEVRSFVFATAGVLLRVLPIEMHFVDYDYATLNAQAAPHMTERFVQTEGLATLPTRGAVSTSPDQMNFDAGQVIFRPGDKAGQYFVVVQGKSRFAARASGPIKRLSVSDLVRSSTTRPPSGDSVVPLPPTW